MCACMWQPDESLLLELRLRPQFLPRLQPVLLVLSVWMPFGLPEEVRGHGNVLVRRQEIAEVLCAQEFVEPKAIIDAESHRWIAPIVDRRAEVTLIVAVGKGGL